MSREQILDEWLTKVLHGTSFRRTPLAGDASFRRYYRIHAENPFEKSGTLVVMDAPPPENPLIFAQIASHLDERGLSVPKVFASSIQEGFLLLSDLGDRLYLQELNDRTAPALYEDAIKALVSLQGHGTEVPSFDRSFMERQWSIFTEWYLSAHLNAELTASRISILNQVFEVLLQVIEAQPFVFVHRDYHSRNLMLLEKGNPGILDFQDAMQGPITYDLVSLLQDCYISWSREKVLQWIELYRDYFRNHVRKQTVQSEMFKNRAHEAHETSLDEFIRWFDLTGVQRHLKNLGIFSRLHYRDGKSHYLKDLEMPFKYILEASERYPELKELGILLQTLNRDRASPCVP